MPNDNTTNSNHVNGGAGDNGNPRKVEYIEPIETPELGRIEPTASFAVDIKTDFEGPLLMKTQYTLHFRPATNWAGKEYGFDWLRVGDSGQWNDKKARDHLVWRIGKYYKTGTYIQNAVGNIIGNQQIVLNCILGAKIIKAGTFSVEGANLDDKHEIWVWLEGSGNVIYVKLHDDNTNTAPLASNDTLDWLPYMNNKPVMTSVTANATVRGELHGVFSGTDDGVSNTSTLSISGDISGSVLKTIQEGEYLHIILTGTLTSQTSDIGYYGNDFNDYRYMKSTTLANRGKKTAGGNVIMDTSFVPMPASYKKMLRENFPVSFAIQWKLREQIRNRITPPTNPIDYEIYKSNIVYYAPILFIREGRTAKLRIKPEVDSSIPFKPIRIDFKESVPAENNFSILSFTGNMDKGGEIAITCNNQFSDFKYIDAIAVYDDPDDPKSADKIEVRCGQIRIHPNHVIRRLNIVFISVKTSGDTPNVPTNSSKEVQYLKNLYEEQAMMDIQIDSLSKPLVIPNSVKITHENLCNELRNRYPNTYHNHIKIFFINGGGTSNTAYNQRCIILREKRLYETLAHEMGHALGLPHTFTCKEAADRVLPAYRTGEHIDPSVNAEFTYQGIMTENIMDYSHSENDSFESKGDAGGTTGRRFALYYWQIRQIWADVDRLNGGAMTHIPMESSNATTESQSYEVYSFRSKVRI